MVALNTAYAPSETLERSHEARQRVDGALPGACPQDGLKQVPFGRVEPQNRVGDFFYEGTDRFETNRLPTRNCTGKNGVTVTIIVSGRTSWLSRDPIAENGGN